MANDQVIFETTTYLVRFTAKWTLPTFAIVPDFVYPHQLFLFESRFVITQEASIFFSVQGPSWQTGFYELAMTDRNMQAR